MARVSVIVPTFNCAPYIGETVRSISAQTETDIEIVVADDGSTDGTLSELERLARKEPRLRFSSLPHSGKPSMVRNAAIRRATGEYITFLDGDDLFHPRKLERQVSVLRQFADVDLVFSDMRVFWGHPTESEGSTYLDSFDFKNRAASHMRDEGGGVFLCNPSFYKFMSIEVTAVTTQTLMVRRSVFGAEDPWFREELGWAEDVELWLRLARGHRVAFIDDVLAYYRRRPDSISNAAYGPVLMGRWLVAVHLENLAAGGERFTHEDRRRYSRKIARCLFELGYMHFERRELREARAAYRQSMAVSPQWTTTVALLKTFAPNGLLRACRRVALMAQCPD